MARMHDEEVRSNALLAAIRYYELMFKSPEDRILRQQVVETAVRFEEYIRSGT